MKDAVKKYRNRRDARLGFPVSEHFDSVEEYRMRRAERIKKAKEEEKEFEKKEQGVK